MEIIKEIFEKWKVDYEDKYVTILCKSDYIQKNTNLHYFYKPVDMSKLFKKMKWYLPKDLKEFYKNFNGMRLFFSSFSIYGTQINRFETKNTPFDILIENFSRSLDRSYIVFGCILGGKVFAYKNDKKCSQYYELNENDFSVIRTYESLNELLVEKLTPFLEEYNLDGTRKHPRVIEIAKNYPMFAHQFTGEKDWDLDKQK